MSARQSVWAYPLVLFPRRIKKTLAQLESSPTCPSINLWQVGLGALRMVHRLIFRPNTIGTCTQSPVRKTWRARILKYRPIRFPFLLTERAIAPLDLTGLASSKERVIRHLLGAHHDGNQFAYDLQMLSIWPGALRELAGRVDAVVDGSDPRSQWLRDLVVFEGYHENLQTAVRIAMDTGVHFEPDEELDPDISFSGFLNWCAQQPDTPRMTIRAMRQGRFSFQVGKRS